MIDVHEIESLKNLSNGEIMTKLWQTFFKYKDEYPKMALCGAQGSEWLIDIGILTWAAARLVMEDSLNKRG